MSTNHLGGAIPQGDQNTWMPDVWGYLVVRFGIGITLDIGCGYGYTCKWFTDLGLTAAGVDGWPECVEKNICKSARIVLHDFTKGPYIHGTPFDLAWSAEFLEHVEEKYLPNLAVTFQQARYAVITHAEPHQCGQHHVNCNPDSYWERVFESWGFRHLRSETELLRRTDRSRAAWGRRTLMVFERI